MKKVIIGFIAGAVFATAGTAAANTIIEKVTASIRTDYSVELDGEKLNLEKSPIAYKGSSYLPLKELGEIFEKEVSFDDGVIKLKSKGVGPLVDLDNLTKEQYDIELERLQGELNSMNMFLEMFDFSVSNMSEEHRQEALKDRYKHEDRVKKAEKAIADLKAKYPQYQ